MMENKEQKQIKQYSYPELKLINMAMATLSFIPSGKVTIIQGDPRRKTITMVSNYCKTDQRRDLQLIQQKDKRIDIDSEKRYGR